MIPTPPVGQRALADSNKPPSKTQVAPAISPLTTETKPVEAVQAPPAPEPVPEPIPAPTPVVATSTQPTDANADKMFIYQHESGNNPAAVNSIGCRGLGQACPGSKLPCGDDYACQDAYFTAYMTNRYGTWANARAWWEGHRWW